MCHPSLAPTSISVKVPIQQVGNATGGEAHPTVIDFIVPVSKLEDAVQELPIPAHLHEGPTIALCNKLPTSRPRLHLPIFI
eukprot:509131-Pyramimonas_sp.AAC.1